MNTSNEDVAFSNMGENVAASRDKFPLRFWCESDGHMVLSGLLTGGMQDMRPCDSFTVSHVWAQATSCLICCQCGGTGHDPTYQGCEDNLSEVVANLFRL